MKIAAADVNKLRKQTGAGMMDCKKALVEAEGDFEAAIDVLRKKGQKIAAKRADRDASEGVALTKRTLKPSQENPKGGFTERERSLHVSNLMALESDKASRIGFKVLEDKSKVRVSKRSGKELG